MKYEVKISDQTLKLKRLNVLRAIKYWQQAEPDTPEEAQCEERLRNAVEDLKQWDKATFEKAPLTVEELNYRLREEMNLVGKEIN